MATIKKAVFVCHTSPDKLTIVRPLVQALEAAGLSSWVDEAEIRWGDDIVSKVNEGLSQSEYVLVVLSPAFLGRHWPEKELNSALHIEAGSGKVRVLPLLAGSPDEQERIRTAYPLLTGKRYLRWPDEANQVVNEIRTLLGLDVGGKKASVAPDAALPARLRTPRIRRAPSDLERNQFLATAYADTRSHFAAGISELTRADEHVKAEIVDVDAQKFVCRIYSDGKLLKQCKIWIGGLGYRSEQLSYAEGNSVDARNDNSFNDWLIVRRDDLGWEPSGFGRGSRDRSDASPLSTTEDAAIYFWERYIDGL